MGAAVSVKPDSDPEIQASIPYQQASLPFSSEALLYGFIHYSSVNAQPRKKIYKAAARLGLPPRGLTVTEIGLSPGRQHDGAVDGLAVGKGKGEGGRAADNLCTQVRASIKGACRQCITSNSTHSTASEHILS